MRQQLHQTCSVCVSFQLLVLFTKDERSGGRTGVEEDTGRSGIEDTADDARLGTVSIVRLAHPETNGDTDGRAD